MALVQPPPSDYERSLCLLDSPEGQLLAAHIDDSSLQYVVAACDSFEAQIEGSWCALAAIVCACKALSLTSALPEMTQVALFQHVTGSTATSGGLRAGISLGECEQLLASLGLRHASESGPATCQIRSVSANDANAFAAVLCADLGEVASGSKLMLVNVLRQVKGIWTGHWMVVAARVTTNTGDSWALVLDPAAHKLGAHFLPEGTLVAAMCTLNSRGEARGYVMIESG